MAVQQISVFLENKPGTLNELTDLFTANDINLRALSLAETEGFGIVRVIVDDVYTASTILKDNGYVSSVTNVLAVALEDKIGSLQKVLHVLGENGINIDYMYAFTSHKANCASLILKVADRRRAKELLTAGGFRLITQEELSK